MFPAAGQLGMSRPGIELARAWGSPQASTGYGTWMAAHLLGEIPGLPDANRCICVRH